MSFNDLSLPRSGQCHGQNAGKLNLTLDAIPIGMIEIREIEYAKRLSWNSFVLAHPAATPFHLFEWKPAIEGAYGLRVPYLAALDGGTIVGILPTVISGVPLGSRRAVSLAFCNYAGWLILQGRDEDSIGKKFVEHLARHGVNRLELRRIGNESSGPSQEALLQRQLPASAEILWDELDAKVRNQVRKAGKSGLVARWGADQLDEFYCVYAQNMWFLGSPAHSKVFFGGLLEQLPSVCTILTIRLEEKVISAMFVVGFRHQLTDPWASSLREYDALCPNMLMYWEAMRHGCANGYTVFDFGRSRLDSATFRFKMQWGSHPIPLDYRSLSTVSSPSSVSTDFYRSPAAGILSQLWRKLPLRLATIIGPRVRKYLP